MSENHYHAVIAALSRRLVTAQQPIRILDAIQWDDSLKQKFFAANASHLPAVDADYYRAQRPLRFDIDGKRQELHAIERDIMRQLGQLNPVGAWLRRTCREYLLVVDMLEARGTTEFSALSQELLDSGRSFVFLFTDLANPTSNHIYQTIGYQPVYDVDEYEFV